VALHVCLTDGCVKRNSLTSENVNEICSETTQIEINCAGNSSAVDMLPENNGQKTSVGIIGIAKDGLSQSDIVNNVQDSHSDSSEIKGIERESICTAQVITNEHKINGELVPSKNGDVHIDHHGLEKQLTDETLKEMPAIEKVPIEEENVDRELIDITTTIERFSINNVDSGFNQLTVDSVQPTTDRVNSLQSKPTNTADGDKEISKCSEKLEYGGSAMVPSGKGDPQDVEILSSKKMRIESETSKDERIAFPGESMDNTTMVEVTSKTNGLDSEDAIEYVVYESEKQMPDIMQLITKDLSEPYSIYTYRYFIHNWPKLCFLAMHRGNCVGAIVCKLDTHKKIVKRGYIAMLAVAQEYRKKGIGSHLVIRAIKGMVADNCDEVVLETEISNQAALHLYENLGFVRDKRLFRYYLNGVDALRLKLWLK
jgi:peptide alpha-N-acetyltransferase